MNKLLTRSLLTGFISFIVVSQLQAQRYLTGVDSSLFIRDTVRPLVKRFENLRFSGYIQPQFQVIETKGARTYGGGDFAANSDSRFMLRRARMKMDFLALNKNKLPKALFTFQIDATERVVRVRDMFMRVYESKHNNFSLFAGIFSKPFGYEVNLSSSYRETPERGRMSQLLIPSERGLGFMVSYEPQQNDARNKYIKVDLGVFNGPGLSATTDFDSKKDFVARITFKPVKINSHDISGGLSFMRGGWEQFTKYVYTTGKLNSGDYGFVVDSSESNKGKTATRQYYGADVQYKLHHAWGVTEIRGEFWAGKQPGTAQSTVNPGTLPAEPTYIRNFNGAFFYFLQHIVNPNNQLLIKYDWYDPNTRIAGKQIGKAGTNFTPADLKYSTLGIGYARELTDYVKLVLYYEFVRNEQTVLAGYTSDIRDNLLTCRMQLRF